MDRHTFATACVGSEAPARYRAELIEITLAVWSPPPFSIDASTNRRNHHRLLMLSH